MPLSPPGRHDVSLEVAGNYHTRTWRDRLDLLHEQRGLAQTLVLRSPVWERLLVPVRGEDEPRAAQGPHQSARVIVDLEPLAGGRDQRDVRSQALDLAFDVVPRAEPEEPASGQADQIRKGPALHVVGHAPRPAEVARHDAAVVVVLAVERRVQARDHL